MKLEPRTYHVLWDVHAWSGVLGSLVLVVVFFFGGLSVFRDDINAWANGDAGVREELRYTPLLAELDMTGVDFVILYREENGLRAQLYRRHHGSRAFRLKAGHMARSRSDLGTFFYSMHFLGPIPGGKLLSGIASLALALAIVTGLLIQLRVLVRQLVRVRPKKPVRTWASDVHKVLGVLGLPYQMLFAWTGVLLCVGGALHPIFEKVVFGGDGHAFSVASGVEERSDQGPSGYPAPGPIDLDAALATARERVRGLEPVGIVIENPGDAAATVRFYGIVPSVTFGAAEVKLRASDREILHAEHPSTATVFRRFERWFFGLHYARFGGLGVKLVYAFLAFATCAVIITGNVVWLERRDRGRTRRSTRVLLRLTVGVSAGMLLATAAAAALRSAFFPTWILVVVIALVRPLLRRPPHLLTKG